MPWKRKKRWRPQRALIIFQILPKQEANFHIFHKDIFFRSLRAVHGEILPNRSCLNSIEWALHSHNIHFSNNVCVLAILPLVVLARGTEAREPAPKHSGISLKWAILSVRFTFTIYKIFTLFRFPYLANDLVDVWDTLDCLAVIWVFFVNVFSHQDCCRGEVTKEFSSSSWRTQVSISKIHNLLACPNLLKVRSWTVSSQKIVVQSCLHNCKFPIGGVLTFVILSVTSRS